MSKGIYRKIGNSWDMLVKRLNEDMRKPKEEGIIPLSRQTQDLFDKVCKEYLIKNKII